MRKSLRHKMTWANRDRGMASFISLAILSGSVLFFFIGFIFTIIGYATFWLIPREEYAGGNSQIDGVGLRQACFTQFRFTLYIQIDTIFDGCYDNSKRSARFTDLNKDVWSPRKFPLNVLNCRSLHNRWNFLSRLRLKTDVAYWIWWLTRR